MAAQQLPRRRRAGPRDPGGPAAGVLPRAAEARLRESSRGIPRVYGLAWCVRRAHRQPDRARDAGRVSSARTSACSRSRSASSGPWRSRCGSCSSRTSGVWPSGGRPGNRARRGGRDRRCAARHGRRAKPEPARGDPDAGGAPVPDGLRGAARPEAARAGPRGHAGARLARSAGWRARGRRPTRSCASSTRSRWPRTRPCATSSRACACCRRPTGRTSSRASASCTRRSATGTRVAEMDFPTRDRYRHAVEELSRGCGHDELEVARRAVEMAATPPRPDRGAAPGRAAPRRPRLLPDRQGTPALERSSGYRLPVRQWLRRAWFRRGRRRSISARSRSRPPRSSRFRCRSPRAARPRWSRHPARAPRRCLPASDLAIALIHRFVTQARGAAASAQARARRRRAGGRSHPRRHSDAPDRRGGDPRSGPTGWRCTTWPIRIRSCGSRCSRTGPTRPSESLPEDEALLEAARAAIRELNDAARAGGRRRRPLLGPPPPAPLERERGRLDGLGAQARQAARAEPAAARRDGHVLPAAGGRRRAALRHPLRDHARRRHAAARARRRAGWSGRSRTR